MTLPHSGNEVSLETRSKVPTTSVEQNIFEKYNHLNAQEISFLNQLKCLHDSNSSKAATLSLEITRVLGLKQQLLAHFMSFARDEKVRSGTLETATMVVHNQPVGNVIANKYLEPNPRVQVADTYLPLAREGKLQVVASLVFALSGESLSRTLDNRQDILQGQTIVPVDATGTAVFRKVKIMEVSSKHNHQAFSLCFQLQKLASRTSGDSSGSAPTPLGQLVKTAAVQVQSRLAMPKGGPHPSEGLAAPPHKRLRRDESNYVDITPLLRLPQKEAATRLGISESMLCKRFKECTRRKWPYRYLRKIDKMIRVLTSNRKSTGSQSDAEDVPESEDDIQGLSAEDKLKIQNLKKERAECLQPVKIRITGSDKVLDLLDGQSQREDDDEEEEIEANMDEEEEVDQPQRGQKRKLSTLYGDEGLEDNVEEEALEEDNADVPVEEVQQPPQEESTPTEESNSFEGSFPQPHQPQAQYILPQKQQPQRFQPQYQTPQRVPHHEFQQLLNQPQQQQQQPQAQLQPAFQFDLNDLTEIAATLNLLRSSDYNDSSHASTSDGFSYSYSHHHSNSAFKQLQHL